MANRGSKAIKQIKLIENNIKLIEMMFYIYRGQVLDLDLKEICMKYKIYETENQYKNVIKNLINADVVRVEKLVNTNNNVLIVQAPVYNFYNLEGKTTRYSIETVTRNSYLTYMLKTVMKYNENEGVLSLRDDLENTTTLLSLKENVESCYKMFDNILTEQGKEAKKEDIYRACKKREKLKNRKEEVVEEIENLMYKNTLQSLRRKDIYFVKGTMIITDNNCNFRLGTLTEKIGMAIKTVIEQVEIDKKRLDIVVLVKDKSSKNRLENSFISRYKDDVVINIQSSLNNAIQSEGSGYKANYELQEKESVNSLYVFKNTYIESGIFATIRIKIFNTNIAYKHNSDLKQQGLIEYKKKQKENSMRKQIIEELRAKGLLKEDITDDEIEKLDNI